jgi:hypothetical protein
MNVVYVKTEQVSNKKIQNKRNHNNQISASMPTEQVSARNFIMKS